LVTQGKEPGRGECHGQRVTEERTVGRKKGSAVQGHRQRERAAVWGKERTVQSSMRQVPGKVFYRWEKKSLGSLIGSPLFQKGGKRRGPRVRVTKRNNGTGIRPVAAGRSVLD